MWPSHPPLQHHIPLHWNTQPMKIICLTIWMAVSSLRKNTKWGIIRRWPSNYSLGFFSKSLDNTMDIWYFCHWITFVYLLTVTPCVCAHTLLLFTFLFPYFQGASRQNFGAWTSKLHQLIIWKLSTFFYSSFNLKWVNQYAKCLK